MTAYNPEEAFKTGHADAFEIALRQFRSIDLHAQCAKCGADWDSAGRGAIGLRFMGRECHVDVATAEVVDARDGTRASPRCALLVLHYICRAKGTPLSEDMVTFREVPDGVFYWGSFRQRVLRPLIEEFGMQPDLLIERGRALGALASTYGDISLRIDAFPKVPVILLIWKGDEEFPPDANILFDASVPQYMTTEDIAVLSEEIVARLARRF